MASNAPSDTPAPNLASSEATSTRADLSQPADQASAAEPQVDFGFTKVAPADKTRMVEDVFKKVAARYDIMNDFMSFGTHRLFKRMVVQMSGARPGHRILDLAGGTGDMAALFAEIVGASGRVVLADYNEAMLSVGRDRLLDRGQTNIEFCRTRAEHLPFTWLIASMGRVLASGYAISRIRITHCARYYGSLKPGAALIVLEFSKPNDSLLGNAYGLFQSLWGPVGRAVVGDAAPYEYLVESIKVHPDQKALKQMFEDAGFTDVAYHNLLDGIAAIHRGQKPSNSES